MTADEPTRLRRVGVIVEAVRMDREITQAALARSADMDVRTIKALEAGTKWPQDLTRSKIEQALRLQPGILEKLLNNPDLAERFLQGLERSSATAQKHATVHATPALTRTPDLFSDLSAAELLLAGRIKMATDRMQLLTTDDLARVQQLIDTLGRARHEDWDERFDRTAYDLAWPSGVRIGVVDDEARAIADEVHSRRGN